MLRQMFAAAAAVSLIAPQAHARKPRPPGDLVAADLLRVRAQMARTMTAEQIDAHNAQMLASLPASVNSTNRATKISVEYAQNMVSSISSHPVAGFSDWKYQQPNVQIGYCFGRAAYAHLALLKLGLTKRGIKKIWAVGPMKTGDIRWDFHVATIAMTDQGWMSIDNFPGQSLTVQQWMDHVKTLSTDGKLTFFITEPQKFSVSLSTYDRIQLGLDLTPETDWYKHYFKDLMTWFSKDKEAKKYFNDYNLQDLRNPPTS